VLGGLVGCRERVREIELLGESGKSRVRGPEAVSADDSRGQQVDINPSGPLTMQTAIPYKRAARSGTLRAPPSAAPPKPAEATLGFSSTRKTIDNSPGWRYCSDQKKRLFKFPMRSGAPTDACDASKRGRSLTSRVAITEGF
jgi:hypothetical protein